MLMALWSLALVIAGLRRLARTLSPSLYDTIIELAQERNELREELQGLVSGDVALSCDGHELLKRRCTLSRETAALARAKADLAQDLLNFDIEKAGIVAACDDKSAELEQLVQLRDARHNELECAQATLMTRQRELDQTLATLDTTRSDIVSAEHELSHLRGQAKTTRDQYDVEVAFMESRAAEMQQTLAQLDKEVIAAQDWLKSFEKVASDRKKDLRATELEVEQEHCLMEEAHIERSQLEEKIARLNEELRSKAEAARLAEERARSDAQLALDEARHVLASVRAQVAEEQNELTSKMEAARAAEKRALSEEHALQDAATAVAEAHNVLVLIRAETAAQLELFLGHQSGIVDASTMIDAVAIADNTPTSPTQLAPCTTLSTPTPSAPFVTGAPPATLAAPVLHSPAPSSKDLLEKNVTSTSLSPPSATASPALTTSITPRTSPALPEMIALPASPASSTPLALHTTSASESPEDSHAKDGTADTTPSGGSASSRPNTPDVLSSLNESSGCVSHPKEPAEAAAPSLSTAAEVADSDPQYSSGTPAEADRVAIQPASPTAHTPHAAPPTEMTPIVLAPSVSPPSAATTVHDVLLGVRNGVSPFKLALFEAIRTTALGLPAAE